MKKKICKLSAAVLLFFSGIMEIGWRFFNMVVCCKRGGRKKERKKWFELSHIRDNHPRNGYAKEYDESRAWCETQKMQDCYIQSVDGLKLHGFYLPAEHAKRFVILSHGYRGSRFGSLSFMAKYLHEHQCNLLFMEQRCCGESEGNILPLEQRKNGMCSVGQFMCPREIKKSFQSICMDSLWEQPLY